MEGMSKKNRTIFTRALSLGRALCVCGALFTVMGWGFQADAGTGMNGEMTAEEAVQLGEEFGIAVGEVDEEVQKELKLQRPEGVAVFEVIGNSRADYAGIKVRSVIKEIDKKEVRNLIFSAKEGGDGVHRNLIDFGKAVKAAMKECNFTVGTYEPADPGDPVGWGVNFHFVGCKRD